jgi:hypothetical protein
MKIRSVPTVEIMKARPRIELLPLADAEAFRSAWKEISRFYHLMGFFTALAKGVGRVVYALGSTVAVVVKVFEGGELVQRVGPGVAPKHKHEWDGSARVVGPFPLRSL